MASLEEVRVLVDESVDHGAIEPEEQEMIHSVIDLQTTQAQSATQRECVLREIDQDPRRPYVERCLASRPGPVVANSDYMAVVAEQIRPYVPGRFASLGTEPSKLQPPRRIMKRPKAAVSGPWVRGTTSPTLGKSGLLPGAIIISLQEGALVRR